MHFMQQHVALPAATRHPRSVSTRATAKADLPVVSLSRLPDAEQVTTVVERRAADVCVVGGSCTAVLAAYSLAKAGKKVVLLPDYGLSAPTPQPSRLQPLKLTDTDPLLAHFASESSSYWRGLELLAGSPLLSPHQTCDLVLNPDRDHAGALGFSKLQEACRAAGVITAPLSSSEVMTQFRQLKLPPDASGLLQPDGAVLHAADIAGATQTLADKAGVISRPGLLLRGWRDRGSCFQLRASSRLSPELVTDIEAEVLLLAPAQWHNTCLELFGLRLEGLEAREVLTCRLPAGILQQQQQQPLWQSWGGYAAADDPQQPEGVCALPLAHEGSTGWVAQQLPAWGVEVSDPFSWQPAAQAWLQHRQQTAQDANQDTQTGTRNSSWVGFQLQQLHSTCQQLTRDTGPLNTARPSSSLRSCTADGRPIIGQHPGFDEGRIIIACGASGSQQYGPGSSSSSYQLSPMLAKVASDLIKSAGAAGAGDAVQQGLAMQREGLQAVRTVVSDSWEQLSNLQNPKPSSAEVIERQQDEAADQRQDLANLDKAYS